MIEAKVTFYGSKDRKAGPPVGGRWGAVLQPVGRTEQGVGRELGKPLVRTRPLWVSMEPDVEEAGAEAGCSMTCGPAPHTCVKLTNPTHCMVPRRQVQTYANPQN